MNSVYTHQITDENNNTLPWFTYPTIEYLAQLDLSDKTVFEWGSGNSSSYFSRNCKKVISVENNVEWYNIGINNKRENQELFFANNKEEYINYIKNFDKFDIILIDGDFRQDCALLAAKFLNKTGIIIFDNSNWYVDSCSLLRNNNFIQIDFHGMGPLNKYAWTTTIFFSRKYDFNPIDNYQPKKPIGGNLIFNHNE
jgi:16S rRNA G966 N2-methylase RsmD